MLFYIDPGTGSMLFTVLIGIISAVVYGLRGLFIKLKYSIGSGKKEVVNDSVPFVIYTDSKRYWNLFKGIVEEFEKRKINLTYLTQSKDDPIFDYDYKYIKAEYIGEGNKGFAKLNFLKADIVLSTTPGLDVYQWKRSKDVKCYIHLVHMPNDILTYRMFGIDYFDAIIVNGEFQVEEVRKLEEIRKLPHKDIKVLGLPYFDVLKDRLDKSKIEKNDNKTVLLAPSWGPSSILNKYGKDIIDALISTGYNIIVRPHPQSFVSEKEMIDELINKYPTIEFNKDNDNFDVLNKADILISDFSGVIFDFALVFDKPIIYADTSFDSSPYDAWWINEDLWTFKVLPTIGKELKKEQIADIKELINDTLNNQNLKEGRIKAKDEAWTNKGVSSSLIVDYLVNKLKETSYEKSRDN